MMSLILSAFFLGALGSTHCIGMCGPITLSLPTVNNTNYSRFVSGLLYNIGRLVMYSCLGLLIGISGYSAGLMGFQNRLSVLLGTLMLILLFFPVINKKWDQIRVIGFIFNQIRKSISRLFNNQSYLGVFAIGLLNGLLPCGLVYIALAGAVAAGNMQGSMMFMLFFGLGTFPLLWAFSFFGIFATMKMRRVFKLTYPIVIFVMACMLILRGLDIDILHHYLHSNLNISGNSIGCHH